MNRTPRKNAFTLVELLVVITIIGILIALLLPAVQAAREAARRTQCANNLKQISLAMHSLVEQNGVLPQGELGTNTSGLIGNTGATWSAFMLPFIEQQPLYDSLKIAANDAIDAEWAVASATTPYDATTATGRNILACETVFDSFRCPSAAIPLHVRDISVDGYYVNKRVPGTYLGCASGIVASDTHASDFLNLDGVLFNHSKITFADISDGLSNTLLVCEALPDAIDSTGPESRTGGVKDHWYIGGDDADTDKGGHHGLDHSEALGSTGVGINLPKDGSPQYELSFSSAHSGGCQGALCDGSVHFFSQSIDATTWHRLGNRKDGMPLDGSKF